MNQRQANKQYTKKKYIHVPNYRVTKVNQACHFPVLCFTHEDVGVVIVSHENAGSEGISHLGLDELGFKGI
jgi:hypothetical protein